MNIKITARNNEWNRKYSFTGDDSTGFLIEIKNGMAYFGWKYADGKINYYKCEESVFEKNFGQTGEAVMIPAGNVTITYMRYPVEH